MKNRKRDGRGRFVSGSYKHSKATKRKISLAVRDENNFNWKGNRAGYASIHKYVVRRKPKPAFCELCKKNKPTELAKKKRRRYNRNPDNYYWLCNKCHFRYDNKSKKLNKGHKIYWAKHKKADRFCIDCKKILPFSRKYNLNIIRCRVCSDNQRWREIRGEKHSQ